MIDDVLRGGDDGPPPKRTHYCPKCGSEMRDCPRWKGTVRDWVCPNCGHIVYGHESKLKEGRQ